MLFFSPEVVPYKFDGNAVEVKQISSGMHHSVLLSKNGKIGGYDLCLTESFKVMYSRSDAAITAD